MEPSAPLILASASPRRRALLEEWGIPFEVVRPDVEEWEPAAGDPRAVAAENATRKLEAVRSRHPGRGVLAADTVVAVQGGEAGRAPGLLAKPTDVSQAREMLLALSGRSHEVHTAVAMALPGVASEVQVESARVTFRAIAPAEIERYLEAGEWQGKAGAYAIQGDARRFVSEFTGELETIIGLPRRWVEERLSGREESGCTRP